MTFIAYSITPKASPYIFFPCFIGFTFFWILFIYYFIKRMRNGVRDVDDRKVNELYKYMMFIFVPIFIYILFFLGSRTK